MTAMPLFNQPPRVPAAILGPRRLVEDDPAANTLGGSLLAGASDPDPSDVLRIASVNGVAGGPLLGRYGLLTWNATSGAYAYTLDNSLAAVQALGAGALVRERFDVAVADSVGATATTRLLIDIGGVNDAPRVKTVAAALTEDAATSVASGNLLLGASDVDRGDVLRIASVDGIATGVVNGKFGVLGWNATTGGYTYTLDNARAATDGLKAGAIAQERFRFVVEDGRGGSAASTLTVSVTGANDAPRSPGLALAVTEGTTTAPGAPRSLNLLAGATDAEKDAIGIAGIAGLTAAGTVQGLYGTLVWNGAGGASYTLDNARAATNGLKAGLVAQDVFAFTLADSGGAQRSAAITVSVTGTNDAPTNAGASLAATEPGTAPGPPLLYGANLLAGATDPDGDVLTVLSIAGLTDPGTVQGLYGTLIWAGDGTASYQVTSKALKPGQVAQERFAYTVSDGQGGTATADLVVAVTGANDAPDARDQVGSVAPGLRPALTAAGNLLTGATDPEGDAVGLVSIDAGALGTTIQTAYGSLRVQASGAYSYFLNPGKAAYIALPGGPATETFGFTVSDGQGGTDRANLVITVAGRNDAATIGGLATGAVAEDGVLTAEGRLTITDPDTGEARFRAPSSLAGTYGNFTLDPLTGAWSYALNNASAKVQSLYEGQTVQDRLDVVSLDGTAGRSLVVSIAGQGAPLAVTADTLFGREGQTLLFGFALPGVSLPPAETLLSNDLPGEGSPLVLGGVFELRHGLLSLLPDGGVSYIPNDPNFFGRDDFNYTIRDVAGGEAAGHVAIFIQNVPDPLLPLTLGGLAARGEGFRILGGATDFGVGFSLAGSGDFNGDGRADIAIGGRDPTAITGGERSSPYVVFGQATPGDVDLAPLSIVGPPTEIGAGATVPGVRIGDEPTVQGATGYAFAWLGDLNGDGRDELAVLSGGSSNLVPAVAGAIDVLFGRTATDVIPLGSDPPPGGGFRILPPADLIAVQQMVRAGDVNGDGLADLLVGIQARGAAGWSGASFVVFGKADQTPVDLGALATSGDGFRINGAFTATSTDNFGGDVVAAPGDVNGDGLDDLLISSVGLGLTDSTVSVVFGKAGSATVSLTDFDAQGQGYRIATGGWVTQLAGLGDINGDGLADFALGAPTFGNAAPGVVATILYGKADSAPVDLGAIGPGAGGFRITDTTGVLHGAEVTISTVGDLNRDGRDDLFVAARAVTYSVEAEAIAILGVVVFSPGSGVDVDIAQVTQGLGGFAVVPEGGWTLFGSGGAIATALGDVNGDGFDDFGLGLRGWDLPGRLNAGVGYVVHGQAGWAIDTPIL